MSLINKLRRTRNSVTPRTIGAQLVSVYADDAKRRTNEVIEAIQNGDLKVTTDPDSEDRIERGRRIRRNLLHQLDEELALLAVEDRLRRSIILKRLLQTGAEHGLFTSSDVRVDPADTDDNTTDKEDANGS
jgi:hypothetical protein